MKEFYGVHYRRANNTEGTIFFETEQGALSFSEKIKALNYTIVEIKAHEFGRPNNNVEH